MAVASELASKLQANPGRRSSYQCTAAEGILVVSKDPKTTDLRLVFLRLSLRVSKESAEPAPNLRLQSAEGRNSQLEFWEKLSSCLHGHSADPFRENAPRNRNHSLAT